VYDELEKNKRDWMYHQHLWSRRFLLYISSMVILGVAAFTYSYFFSVESNKLLNIFVFVDVFAIVLLTIYWYLQIQPIQVSAFSEREIIHSNSLQDEISAINEIEEALSIFNDDEKQLPYLESYISNRLHVFPYRHDFSKFEPSLLTDKTRLHLFKTSLKNLKEKLKTQQSYRDEKVKSRSAEDSTRDLSIERMMKLVDMATSRLKEEIAQLSKRANIYIIFGSAITLFAGVFLYFTVQDLLGLYNSETGSPETAFTSMDILSLGIRFSIVVFIEIFAFYYLRLYRNIMENIKFYQNEITNVEMKILALHAVENGECGESLKILASELSKTERNFVIDKNKTTIDIEKSKLDKDIMKSSTDSIVKIFKTIKP